MNFIAGFIKNLVGNSTSARHIAVITDPTLYCIKTISHTYHGRILFQNDMVLKVQTEKPRIVKILKEHIQQITIANNRLNTEGQR